MQILAVQPLSADLAADVVTFPDHLIHSLAVAGVGLVEAARPAHGDAVPWWYTRRRGGESRELARLPIGWFRPTLARFATILGLSPYCGYAVFAAGPAPLWPEQQVHRFSLFLCNEPTMGVWARLYLYCIDGVWPMADAENTEPSGAADQAGT